jgi:APA family basic amino acid/polyamine antiporter
MTDPIVGSPTSPPQLVRRLGLLSATMIVIGSIIGSGIFLTPQSVAAAVDVPGVMILVWIFTGLLTLAGALTNAEIGSEIPEAGGHYVFFRVLYGDFIAFLFGWTTFIVYQTGSIAAIAVAFARYFSYFVPLPHLGASLEAWKIPFIGNIAPLADIGVKAVAVGIIVLLTTVNYFGVRFGGIIQNIFTSMKIAAILGIVIVGFGAGKGSVAHFFPLWGMPTSGPLFTAIGIAMVATLWSYDGWANLTFIGGEVRNPQRNIPLALSLGTIGVIIIYVLTNLAYLYVLPIQDIASSRLVAADVMEQIFPGYGGAVISIAVMISTFGSVNGSAMTTARVFYAMAKDRLFFRSLGDVHPKYHTPAKSLVVQCVWSCLLTLSGTFDQLFTYVMFAGWIFYALGAAGVFILRRKFPRTDRPYSVPGYPWVPFLFVVVAGGFVVNTLISNTADSMVGLLLLVLGVPFYLYWKRAVLRTAA